MIQKIEYTKTNWVDDETVVNAENMNKLESQLNNITSNINTASILLEDVIIKNNEKAPKSTTYTKTEVDALISTLTTNLDWKETVSTFASIATTYPLAKNGWTVSTKDTNRVYRYNGTEWVDILNGVTSSLASNSLDGLMSKTDFKKLNDIKENATKTESSLTNGNIKINGIEANVYTHPSGTNPHSTTKVDVGLGNVDNTSDNDKPVSIDQAIAISLKVDKIKGKQLSTEDFTAEHKDKLDKLNKVTIGAVQPTKSTVGDIWFQTI